MNDLVNFAIRDAIRNYDGKDNIFTLATLSVEICRLASLNQTVIDGRILAVILTGRSDVERLKGGSHYRLIEKKPA